MKIYMLCRVCATFEFSRRKTKNNKTKQLKAF